MRMVHASGRFDAGDPNLEHALDAYAPHADVITLTEVSPAHYATALLDWSTANDWHLWHPRVGNADECAILSREPLDKRAAWRLSDLPIPGRGGAKVYLIAAHVKGGPWIGVWHTPAHNEGLSKVGKAATPTRIYLAALTRLHALRLRMHGGGVVFCADWNLDLRRQPVRARLAKPYPRMTWGWTPGQKNTEGGRVIDGVLTNLPILEHSVTLPAQPRFDHRAVRTVLGLKKDH
jgi:hypothetical protein